MVKRKVVVKVLPICLALGLLSPSPGMAQGGGTTASPLPSGLAVRLPLFKAYSQGKVVYYTNFEASDAAFARGIRGAFAPRLAKAKDDGIDEFFLVTNGVSGQTPVLGSPPGDPDYSPIWRLIRVTWNSGARRTLLTSEADIDAQMANLSETETSIYFNCPVLLLTDDARGTRPRPAPTLALGPQLISWAIAGGGRTGTALFNVETAWHDGRLFAFLGLEAGPAGLDPLLPQTLQTLPKLSLTKIANGLAPADSAVADFWVVPNGVVIDSVPEPDDQAMYSPIWRVLIVNFNEGKPQRPLRSKAEIDAAVAAGDVTIIAPGPNNGADAVFNCPVIDARATTSLPSADSEVTFLVRNGFLTSTDGILLVNDLRRHDLDQFETDVQALVTAQKLTREVGQLLIALSR
jgi:hypothetical protein